VAGIGLWFGQSAKEIKSGRAVTKGNAILKVWTAIDRARFAKV
jgi:hypothetical protein